MGKRALDLNCFSFMHDMISNSIFTVDSLVSRIARKTVYNMLCCICDCFDGVGSCCKYPYVYDYCEVNYWHGPVWLKIFVVQRARKLHEIYLKNVVNNEDCLQEPPIELPQEPEVIVDIKSEQQLSKTPSHFGLDGLEEEAKQEQLMENAKEDIDKKDEYYLNDVGPPGDYEHAQYIKPKNERVRNSEFYLCSRKYPRKEDLQKHFYFPVRHQLVTHLVNYMQRLGFLPYASLEQKKLSVDLAEVIIKWELQHISEASSSVKLDETCRCIILLKTAMHPDVWPQRFELKLNWTDKIFNTIENPSTNLNNTCTALDFLTFLTSIIKPDQLLAYAKRSINPLQRFGSSISAIVSVSQTFRITRVITPGPLLPQLLPLKFLSKSERHNSDIS
uniref:Uncharacterized protein n=1 Tax=Glossina palpalis gambiensis TaxID=67801 RepID=A0A1B0C2A0_9MUSC